MKFFTTLRHAIFGLNDTERLQANAERFHIPFKEEKFWPPFYNWAGNAHRSGCLVSSVLYDAKIGDVVPVFVDDNYRHMYRVSGIGRAGGDDHVVSPLQFRIEYVETLDH
jgi:hypothetical protein